MQVHAIEKAVGTLVNEWHNAHSKVEADVTKWILPPLSCQFLQALLKILPEPRLAFEFGSGCSTHALRSISKAVTSVEDSQEWLTKTGGHEGGIPQRPSDATYIVPLTRHWLSARPIETFAVQKNTGLLSALQKSSLVLVDSPPNPAKREHALWIALRYAPVGSVIVIDDLNVAPTKRFADRIAKQNRAQFHYWNLSIDHTLGIYFKRKQGIPVSLATPREFVGTWLRG